MNLDLEFVASEEAKICLSCDKKVCHGQCERLKMLKKKVSTDVTTCFECLFFIATSGKQGICKKKSNKEKTVIKYNKSRACKKYFEGRKK